jgi:Sortase domain
METNGRNGQFGPVQRRTVQFQLRSQQPTEFQSPPVHQTNAPSLPSAEQLSRLVRTKPQISQPISHPQPQPRELHYRQPQVERRELIADEPRKAKRPKLPIVTLAVMLVILGIGIVVGYKTDNSNIASVLGVNNTASTGQSEVSLSPQLSEAPLAQSFLDSYDVAPNLPRTVQIPKLNLNTRVVSVGADARTKLLAKTDNIYDAGWFSASAKPGEGGVTVIGGYEFGNTKRGAFYGIKTLQVGDYIMIQKGNQKQVKYTVAQVKLFKQGSLTTNDMMTPFKPGVSSLNLIAYTNGPTSNPPSYVEQTLVQAVLAQ